MGSGAAGGNLVLSNTIANNGGSAFNNGLAIDRNALGVDGGTAVYPILRQYQIVQGSFTGTPNTVYVIELYQLGTTSGYTGRGMTRTPISDLAIETDANGFALFSRSLQIFFPSGWISATASSSQFGTSEIGNAVQPITDAIFVDTFEN